MEFLKNNINDLKKFEDNNIEYNYNSIGFRSEDFIQHAKFRIFVIGDKRTYAPNLHSRQTYGFIFKTLISERLNMPLKAINLMNFSLPDIDNSSIVRIIITQCNISKPDVLLCNFTNNTSIEEFIDSLKDMLLLQYYCEKENIPYIFSYNNMETIYDNLKIINLSHRFIIDELKLYKLLSIPLKIYNNQKDIIEHQHYAQFLFDKFHSIYKRVNGSYIET